MISDETNHSRREFLRTLGRLLVGGGLLLGLGRLAVRDPEQCLRQGICRGCPEAADCRLPAALSLREALKKEGRL